MIDLDKADDFLIDLARVMEKHGLGVFPDDMQGIHNHCLKIGHIDVDMIDHYVDDLLENTPRR